MRISSLQRAIATDNQVRFIDAFVSFVVVFKIKNLLDEIIKW